MATDVPTFSFKNAPVKTIPLNKIRENSDALRTEVDKTAEKYIHLVDSVKAHGIMNPISVREIKDPTTGEVLYGLVDGLHRYNAAMDTGLTEINAQVGDIHEGALLEAQIIANVHKIETKPMQYTTALVSILGSNPLMTKAELAARLSHNVKWLEDRLGLTKLQPKIQPLVDEGTLNLSNAYALSKLPPEKQEEYLQAALTKPSLEFTNVATAALKEYNKAVREGRAADGFKYVPQPKLRKMVTLKDQADFAEKQPDQCSVIQSARAQGCTTIESAIAFVLKWVMHMDPETIAADTAKYEQEREDAKKEAAKRKAERDAKKQQIAAELAKTAGA